jgi:hypothetical protein
MSIEEMAESITLADMIGIASPLTLFSIIKDIGCLITEFILQPVGRRFLDRPKSRKASHAATGDVTAEDSPPEANQST